jgi:hypothetical protein
VLLVFGPLFFSKAGQPQARELGFLLSEEQRKEQGAEGGSAFTLQRPIRKKNLITIPTTDDDSFSARRASPNANCIAAAFLSISQHSTEQ